MGSLEATAFAARTRMDKRKSAVVDETLDRVQPEAGGEDELRGMILDHTVGDETHF
jgi:hypothetical protein